MRNFDHNCAHPEAAGPGHWNDPDYIVPSSNLTYDQIKAYISLWVVMSAPLIVSADLSTQPKINLDLITNREAIRISQDPLGAQATSVYRKGDQEVLVKHLADRSKAVCVLNRGMNRQTIKLTGPMIDLPLDPVIVHDVWGQTTHTMRTISLTLAPTSCHLLRVGETTWAS
jgi:alpha-galactosidase